MKNYVFIELFKFSLFLQDMRRHIHGHSQIFPCAVFRPNCVIGLLLQKTEKGTYL